MRLHALQQQLEGMGIFPLLAYHFGMSWRVSALCVCLLASVGCGGRPDAVRCSTGWFRNALVGLEEAGPKTLFAQEAWALTDPEGWAIRSVNETGLWTAARTKCPTHFRGDDSPVPSCTSK